MNTTTRVGGFTLGLVAAFGAATLVGSLVGPVDAQPERHPAGHEDRHGGEAGTAAPHATVGANEEAASGDATGLHVSQDGYTLRLLTDRLEPGRAARVRFEITDSDGRAVTDYAPSHGKELHAILVSRDLTVFEHVHPELDETGVWSTRLALTRPGDYRLFADFKPTGAPRGYTLGHDLAVRGLYDPRPLPAAGPVATTGPYQVRLDGTLVPGRPSSLRLSVTRDGEPVTDLEPYLGAYGHLVALRDGDLAYVHVHPERDPDGTPDAAGPDIGFHAEVPSAGTYRLFLDFKHGGTVHTAAFTTTTAGRQDADEHAAQDTHDH